MIEHEMEKVRDTLVRRLNTAIRQSDVTYIKKKTKTTHTDYDEETKKPFQELVEETEELIPQKGMVDMDCLKTAMGILKEVDALGKKTESAAEVETEAEQAVVFLAREEFDEPKA